jgi:hypothetical protein
MRERDGIAVRRLDRHRLPARRHGAGEGHRSRRRSEDRRAAGDADVDAAVLTARVRVVRVEREPEQNGALRGPRPRERSGRPEQEEQDDDEREPAHDASSVVSGENGERAKLATPSDVVKTVYSEPR